jgi:hypothetical protein
MDRGGNLAIPAFRMLDRYGLESKTAPGGSSSAS